MKSSVTKSIFYQYYISVVAKSSESHQNGYRSLLKCSRWWVWVKPKTLKLVFAAFLLSMQH